MNTENMKAESPQTPQTLQQNASAAVNRNYKAGVFTHLFGEPSIELELYNAFSPEPYPPDTPVIDLTLANVFYRGRVNDLSFRVGEKLVAFFEHQSSINENMPLRFLMYCGRVYEKLIGGASIYSEHRISIPTPEFYVLYNGIDSFPDKETYRLSDAFIQAPNGEMPLDLVVTVYNVNPGYNEEIVKRSETLHSYMTLVSRVREYERCGMERSEAVTQAIKDCIADGILEDYLRNNASEVCSMLTQEWDWDAAKAVWQEEAREEGVMKGAIAMAISMLKDGVSIEFIMKHTQLSADKIINLKKDICLVSEVTPEYKKQKD